MKKSNKEKQMIIQKKKTGKLDPSDSYRTLGTEIIKAPNKQKDPTRAVKITSDGDLRTPKGR